MIIEFSEMAKKTLAKLDKPIQKQIKKYLDEVSKLENPRTRGKSLTGNMAHLWRYRVRDYRIICEIQDEKILITVVKIGHRKNAYD